jgi:CMP/dCMP kinase
VPSLTSPNFFIVAIDGGAASGKSSTSRALSERFGLLHVDTGSFYRAITWKLLEAGARPDRPAEVEATLASIQLGTRIEGREARMEIDGWTPGDEIRSAAVNAHVSLFAALPSVRTALLDYQRRQADVARSAGFPGLIMEGRDIGSVIFPEADFRFFLQADPEARARRRADQGMEDKIHERDRLDSSRATAPLVCPPGAVPIDSTQLSLAEVVEQLAGLIQRQRANR